MKDTATTFGSKAAASARRRRHRALVLGLLIVGMIVVTSHGPASYPDLLVRVGLMVVLLLIAVAFVDRPR